MYIPWHGLQAGWIVSPMQVPEDEWEVYEKGQHLRGADAAYADQALDELVHTATVPCCLRSASAPLL
jgi:hypothetical protein